MREALGAYLADQPRYAGLCAVCSPAEAPKYEAGFRIVLGPGADLQEQDGVLSLAKPVRLGAVLDAIERILKRRSMQGAQQSIAIGPWVLDTLYNRLQDAADPKAEPVRLTEKEKDILVALHGHPGPAMPRDALLEAVWAYADGVETHTLETHIYRLRQKIEDDPAKPQILLTTEAGYQLVSG